MNPDLNSNPTRISTTSNSGSSVLNPKNNDSNVFLVSNPLTGNENYMQWKYSTQIALGAKRKAGFINGTQKSRIMKELSSMTGSETIAWCVHGF
ncbi:hypothetical protein LXL04_027051 [Taraxacum kok-saghyz]